MSTTISWGGITITFGTGSDDVIVTGMEDDLIFALDGDDEISSGGGDDVIFAGGGDDTVDAGSGDDVVYAGSGDDTVNGGEGDDIIWGGSGNDDLYGDSGNDVVIGNSGYDLVWGDAGNDLLIGGHGSDLARGGSGDDVVFLGANDDMGFYNVADNVGAADYYHGGSGYDTLTIEVGSEAERTALLAYIASQTNTNHFIDFNGAGYNLIAVKFEEFVVDVIAVNTPPIAVDDTFSTRLDSDPLTGNVLMDNGNGADSDPDGDMLSVVAQTNVTTANGATVTINTDGSFTYTPLTNQALGADTFDYQLFDGTDLTTGTVTVNVAAANAPITSSGGNETLVGDTADNDYVILDDNVNIIDTGGDTNITFDAIGNASATLTNNNAVSVDVQESSDGDLILMGDANSLSITAEQELTPATYVFDTQNKVFTVAGNVTTVEYGNLANLAFLTAAVANLATLNQDLVSNNSVYSYFGEGDLEIITNSNILELSAAAASDGTATISGTANEFNTTIDQDNTASAYLIDTMNDMQEVTSNATVIEYSGLTASLLNAVIVNLASIQEDVLNSTLSVDFLGEAINAVPLNVVTDSDVTTVNVEQAASGDLNLSGETDVLNLNLEEDPTSSSTAVDLLAGTTTQVDNAVLVDWLALTGGGNLQININSPTLTSKLVEINPLTTTSIFLGNDGIGPDMLELLDAVLNLDITFTNFTNFKLTDGVDNVLDVEFVGPALATYQVDAGTGAIEDVINYTTDSLTPIEVSSAVNIININDTNVTLNTSNFNRLNINTTSNMDEEVTVEFGMSPVTGLALRSLTLNDSTPTQGATTLDLQGTASLQYFADLEAGDLLSGSSGVFAQQIDIAGFNNVTGSIGMDDLLGNDGENILRGDLGNDQLTGRGGNDTFVFDEAGGTDTVSDFNALAEMDLLDVQAFGLTGIADPDLVISDNGLDTTIVIDGGQATEATIILQNYVGVVDTDFVF